MLKNKTKKELINIARDNGITYINSGMLKKDIIEFIEGHIYGTSNQQRQNIKNDLLDQLERNGVVGEFYTDLINDYMAMWDVKNSLIRDIKSKGISVRYQNGENQWGYRKNDSVAELQRTNNQMLKLLDHLGLKPSRQETAEYDPEDLEM